MNFTWRSTTSNKQARPFKTGLLWPVNVQLRSSRSLSSTLQFTFIPLWILTKGAYAHVSPVPFAQRGRFNVHEFDKQTSRSDRGDKSSPREDTNWNITYRIIILFLDSPLKFNLRNFLQSGLKFVHRSSFLLIKKKKREQNSPFIIGLVTK